MPGADDAIIDALRALMSRQRLKMTDLAEGIGVPYRSLQNYMSKRSPMPLAVYVAVCEWIGVTPDYPIRGRFKLAHHDLQKALLGVFGEEFFNSVEFDDHLRWTIGPKREMDRRRTVGNAGTFAGMIESEYDQIREAGMREPEEADPEA